MLLNFMPYASALTGTLLVAAGLRTFAGPAHALLPAVSFAGLAMREGNVVTPRVMGSRMRLSPVAVLIRLLVWAWMWGIPGALLAVPLLTCVKRVAEWTPGWAWSAKRVNADAAAPCNGARGEASLRCRPCMVFSRPFMASPSAPGQAELA